MDLFSENSSGSKILAARHISADKSLPKTNNAINSTVMLCHSYSIQPDFHTYLEALGPYAWVLWSLGFALLVATCVIYVISLRSALRHWRQCAVSVGVVLAVYPLVSSAAFLAILLPRARLIAEAIAQEVVMISMYHLYCTIIAECGGTEQLVRKAGGARLETRVLPCCCWPCCIIPRPKLQKKSLTWLRYLVLQMPVIQAILYILILVLWAEDMRVYLQCFTYIQPFIAASILSGVWGIIMSVRLAISVGHFVKPRFFVLQFVLLIVKLQCGFAKVLPELVSLPCSVDLNPSVFTNMIQNAVMMCEMLLLSIWAWRLYSKPPGKNLDKTRPVSVAVLDDNVRTFEVRTPKEGVENKSFNK